MENTVTMYETIENEYSEYQKEHKFPIKIVLEYLETDDLNELNNFLEEYNSDDTRGILQLI
ncbi:hypothetical protein [Enterococcus phage vB_EfaH_149]|uniref:Uncharacterized protein n=1 Tax=Enterococcus phage vB_EfaH_149 TaxID=2730535 RepID=A0ACA9AT86_9CAUD|nr:hypothetical protein [Enterococcus phage vB_EfaH_149]CAD0300865.1 hypothetical protein [Enterococcus phage 156]VDB76920.1 hypothetical protein PHI156_131 [Enterococcus phage 156]